MFKKMRKGIHQKLAKFWELCMGKHKHPKLCKKKLKWMKKKA